MTYTIEEQFWARPADGTTLDDIKKDLIAQGHTILELDAANGRVHFLQTSIVSR